MNQVNSSKWQQMIDESEHQFVELPQWAQKILLQDINDFVQNRLSVMLEAKI